MTRIKNTDSWFASNQAKEISRYGEKDQYKPFTYNPRTGICQNGQLMGWPVQEQPKNQQKNVNLRNSGKWTECSNTPYQSNSPRYYGTLNGSNNPSQNRNQNFQNSPRQFDFDHSKKLSQSGIFRSSQSRQRFGNNPEQNQMRNLRNSNNSLKEQNQQVKSQNTKIQKQLQSAIQEKENLTYLNNGIWTQLREERNQRKTLQQKLKKEKQSNTQKLQSQIDYCSQIRGMKNDHQRMTVQIIKQSNQNTQQSVKIAQLKKFLEDQNKIVFKKEEQFEQICKENKLLQSKFEKQAEKLAGLKDQLRVKQCQQNDDKLKFGQSLLTIAELNTKINEQAMEIKQFQQKLISQQNLLQCIEQFQKTQKEHMCEITTLQNMRQQINQQLISRNNKYKNLKQNLKNLKLQFQQLNNSYEDRISTNEKDMKSKFETEKQKHEDQIGGLNARIAELSKKLQLQDQLVSNKKELLENTYQSRIKEQQDIALELSNKLRDSQNQLQENKLKLEGQLRQKQDELQKQKNQLMKVVASLHDKLICQKKQSTEDQSQFQQAQLKEQEQLQKRINQKTKIVEQLESKLICKQIQFQNEIQQIKLQLQGSKQKQKRKYQQIIHFLSIKVDDLKNKQQRKKQQLIQKSNKNKFLQKELLKLDIRYKLLNNQCEKKMYKNENAMNQKLITQKQIVASLKDQISTIKYDSLRKQNTQLKIQNADLKQRYNLSIYNNELQQNLLDVSSINGTQNQNDSCSRDQQSQIQHNITSGHHSRIIRREE